jgi:hypothetical protein
MNVTRNRTATNGCFSRRPALTHASAPSPVAGLGGVCGSSGLIAARINDAAPATRKMYRCAADASAPAFDVPSAAPSQSTKPTSPSFGTADQFTRMKMNGHDATIHPIVPHIRTGPNSRAGSFRWVNAIELVIEMVGT